MAQLFETLHYTTSRKMAGSNPVAVIVIFLIIPAVLSAVAYQGYFVEVKAVGAYS